MYYNYHARLKQRLDKEKYIVSEEDINSEFAYRFNFEDGSSMPIRHYRVDEYIKYLKNDK